MKRFIKLSILLIVLMQINNSLASENIDGTWQGTLESEPGQKMLLQFIITQNPDGSYSAVLNSPGMDAIKNIKADSASYNSGELTIDVTDFNGLYEGVLKEGKLEGNWKQEGTSIPLNLSLLNLEELEKYCGTWHGEIKLSPAHPFVLEFHFGKDEKGEFTGYCDDLTQGNMHSPCNNLRFINDTLIFNVSGIRFDLKHTGYLIAGEYRTWGEPVPITLKKGEYVPPVQSLNLPEDAVKKISGEWYGDINTSDGGVNTAVIRFEKTQKGEFFGNYKDETPQSREVPIIEAVLIDKAIILKLKNKTELKAKFAGDELVGELIAGNKSEPLTLKKGKYVPPDYNLNLPDEIESQLSGDWQGRIGTADIVLSFIKSDKNEFYGFMDIQSSNYTRNGLRITEAYLKENNLILKIKLNGVLIEGILADNLFEGEIKKGEKINPLIMEKEKK